MNEVNRSVETFDLSLFDFDDLTEESSAKSGLSLSGLFSDTQSKYPSPSYEPIINNLLQISPDEFLETLEQINHQGKEKSSISTTDDNTSSIPEQKHDQEKAIPPSISSTVREDMQPLISFGDFTIHNKGQHKPSSRQSLATDVSFSHKNSVSSKPTMMLSKMASYNTLPPYRFPKSLPSMTREISTSASASSLSSSSSMSTIASALSITGPISNYEIPSLKPTNNDVLFGRGIALDHPGNIKLKCLIEEHISEFLHRPTSDKIFLYDKIVQIISDSEGRFLKRDKSGEWEEVDAWSARKKVAHAFRNHKMRSQRLNKRSL